MGTNGCLLKIVHIKPKPSKIVIDEETESQMQKTNQKSIVIIKTEVVYQRD